MSFVDTSAWLAQADRLDRDHAAAVGILSRLRQGEFGKPVTTNYVLTEAVTLMRRELGVPAAVRFAEGVETSREVRLMWIEPVLHREAVALMGQHSDKNWSLVDCASFVVMRAMAIETAFTFDEDFSQAGFTTLPS